MMEHEFRHFEYGEPAQVYRYNDQHVICRYEVNGKKQIIPWSLIDGQWKMKSAEKPRPLYNIQTLNGPEGKVVVVEGEKCVDHLKRLGISRIPVCWPGGAQAVKHADWTSLRGRDVLLFPDHDQPGHDCMLWLAGELLKHGSKVSIVKHTADDLPEGWDVADTTWDKTQLNDWLKGRIQPVEPVPEVPRETFTPGATRGRPRSRQDGAPSGGKQFDENGSVFVGWQQLGLAAFDGRPPAPNLDTIQKILGNHPELAGRIWWDDFHGKVFQTLFQEPPAEWADHHDTRLAVWMQRQLRLPKIGHQLVRLAVDDHARIFPRNEPMEWMAALEWDQEERLPTLMTDVFGAFQDDYSAAVGRCWMVSMAARIFSPGCKVDTMPVFEGPQGLRKSTALSIIGGPWYMEMHEDIKTKDFLQNLPGKLLIEIPELHAFGRADINRIKGVISCSNDRYRASYGRRAENHPRRSVWAGTTNRDDYNQDDTGARRFWPILCGEINLEYLRQVRDQLFAEAVYRYHRGEPWWNIDPLRAQEEQDARHDEDPWTDIILSYCKQYSEVTVRDILADVIGLPVAERGKAEQMRVASILRFARFKKVQKRSAGQNFKVWLTKQHDR